LIFATAEETYTFMDKCGVGLQAQDLRHLVLPEKSAVEAALAVHKFLQDRDGDPIFSLREGEESCTYDFAALCCKSIADLNRIHEDEESDAKIRVKSHWEEVQRKQKLAEQIRGEIQTLEALAASLPLQISDLIARTNELQNHKELSSSYQSTLEGGRHRIYESRHNYLPNTDEWMNMSRSLVLDLSHLSLQRSARLMNSTTILSLPKTAA